jgi:hypothetical protein
VFVHHNSVAGDGFKPLAEGAKVDFDDVGFQRGGPRAGAPVASPHRVRENPDRQSDLPTPAAAVMKPPRQQI